MELDQPQRLHNVLTILTTKDHQVIMTVDHPILMIEFIMKIAIVG